MQDSVLHRSFRDHQRDLLRFLMRRLRCAFTARDLAHDLYLKLDDVDGATGIGNGRAYLFRMAANLASDHLRGEARRGEILREAQDLLDGGADWRTPERDVIARDELQRLHREVAALPDLSRRIFQLNRFEGRTHREIAARLGVSVTTVENHIRKVMDRLAAARDR